MKLKTVYLYSHKWISLQLRNKPHSDITKQSFSKRSSTIKLAIIPMVDYFACFLQDPETLFLNNVSIVL